MTLSIDLSGRKALVTGVTRGIGAGIAQKLAEAGCDVAGCGLADSEDECTYCFIEDIERTGRQAHYTTVNLGLPESPTQWVNEAAAALGGVDILVSNAGRNFFEGAATCSEEMWQASMNLNLTAHWRLAQAAYPFLRQSHNQPVIIIITSNHAYYTLPGSFPYNISKAGLVAMVQSLAIEWGPQIRTVGIAPGFVDTPGNEAWFNTFANPVAQRTRTERLHPVGRIGSPAEIGALCAFLASSWSGFISGTTLLIDGGRSALMQDTPSDAEDL